MEILLMVAVVLIALAVITQAGVLIAMYLMSRRLAGKAEALMDDSKRLMAPLEAMTGNLKTVTDDLTETGKIARAQALHIQEIVSESQQNIRSQLADVREVVMDTVQEARVVAMRPVREYSAIAMGIAAGIRTFFSRRRRAEERIVVEKEHPAA